MVNNLVAMPRRDLARAGRKNGGLALIEHPLAEIAEPLRVADGCRRQMQDDDSLRRLTWMGEAGLFIEPARIVHRSRLREVAAVEAAYGALFLIALPGCGPPLTESAATKMLGVLFGALTKRKAEDGNAAMLLAACCEMFSPLSNSIASSTGLWEPVPRHPVTLALAIKKLIATSVFTPSPSELRDAMREAQRKISVLAGYAEQWLQALDRADAILFEHDRATWDANYANTDSKNVMTMRGRLAGDEEGYEDDDGTEHPPSPRWQALSELAKAKEGMTA